MTHCIPIRDLKNTAGVSQMCHNSHEPIFITKNGYEDMVIMSAEVYEKIRLYSVYEKLMEADIAVEHETNVKDALRNSRAKNGL